MKTARVALLSMGVALVAATSASAQWPYAHPNYLGPTAYGVSGTMYGLGLVPVPPYFALHPPVYYSCPVPRSYGYSPYPYPGYVRTPEVEFLSFPQGEAVEPSEPKSEELPPAQPASRVASHGRWIDNPFMASPNAGVIVNPFLDPSATPPVLAQAESNHEER